MHPLNGALPGPYMAGRVTRSALVEQQDFCSLLNSGTFVPFRTQYSRTFVPFSMSLWNDLADPIFDGMGLAGFKSKANASLLA